MIRRSMYCGAGLLLLGTLAMPVNAEGNAVEFNSITPKAKGRSAGLESIVPTHKDNAAQPDSSTPVAENFDDWKRSFRETLIAEGINPEIFDTTLAGAEPDDVVLKLDSRQPEFSLAIWEYLDRAISQKRIARGRTELFKHRKLLRTLKDQYGVDGEYMIAIWALESDFGRNFGNFSVIRSLATLAYEGKRADFAGKQLIAALQILEAGQIEPEQMIGSWAGAMGQPQFIPGTYQRYAVDQDNDGVSDIWGSHDDIFASIANFLQSSGWQAGQPWGLEVRLPKSFPWKLNPLNYEMSVKRWESLGVHSASGEPFADKTLSGKLFLPAGAKGPVFLVFENFEVIKRYNLSTSYVLAVSLLAESISHGKVLTASWPRSDMSLSRSQKEELQTLLLDSGYDVGEVDGIIGPNTRQALRAWQLKHQLIADGYVTVPLLELMREQENVSAN